MRQKDKLEKYLDRLIKKHNGTLCESEKSRYYSVRGRTLRISDHVGIHSGNVSIILDNSDTNHYIIHGHTSGNISVLTYEQTKEFVRTFVQCSYIYTEVGVTPPPIINTSDLFTQEVANYLTTVFSNKQLKQMLNFLKSEGKKKHKQYLELLAIIK